MKGYGGIYRGERINRVAVPVDLIRDGKGGA